MATFIDLSTEDLHTDAVITLIRDHASHPGPKELLFKVSRDTHDRFHGEHTEGVNVSSEEAAEIDEFAGITHKKYMIGKRHECVSCGRLITFYDIFKTGRKVHGDAYLKQFIGGSGYHIQVHRLNPVLRVECAGCGTPNQFDNGCYECDTYTYA